MTPIPDEAVRPMNSKDGAVRLSEDQAYALREASDRLVSRDFWAVIGVNIRTVKSLVRRGLLTEYLNSNGYHWECSTAGRKALQSGETK